MMSRKRTSLTTSDNATSCFINFQYLQKKHLTFQVKHILVDNWLPCNVRQPLNSQARPFQSMRHHHIVEKWRIFFPYFIFFVDNSLLHGVVEWFCTLIWTLSKELPEICGLETQNKRNIDKHNKNDLIGIALPFSFGSAIWKYKKDFAAKFIFFKSQNVLLPRHKLHHLWLCHMTPIDQSHLHYFLSSCHDSESLAKMPRF